MDDQRSSWVRSLVQAAKDSREEWIDTSYVPPPPPPIEKDSVANFEKLHGKT
jgi:hypothetical protein